MGGVIQCVYILENKGYILRGIVSSTKKEVFDMNTHKVILPGSTICILGGGQLGKMLLVAAHQLGYHTIVWAPTGDSPAMEMATHRFEAPFDDEYVFETVCNLADVVTTEWENIPVSLLEKFEAVGMLVRPSSKILTTAQSRNAEKTFAGEAEANPVPWFFVGKGTPYNTGLIANYMPLICKTDRFGYDGKGQTPIQAPADILALPKVASEDVVFEEIIDLKCELSVLIARTGSGEISISPTVHNVHKNGILHTSTWPHEFSNTLLEKKVWDATTAIARMLHLEGILVIEFFVSKTNELFFNEMAPRPHNSFHGSMEAAYISQFEQHIHAICNCSLGLLEFHSHFTMTNIIGDEIDCWLGTSNVVPNHHGRLHIYGKSETKQGRKMGHITVLSK